jgi:putative acetyltransferase
MEIVIREEDAADAPAIHALNVAAFGADVEARLVDALRGHGRLTLSLVAVDGAAVVGHIAFSPVSVTGPDGRIARGVGLGPMAVEPSRQRSGIGGKLIAQAFQRLAPAGFCVVVGHADYYPRFGFVRASRFGIRWDAKVPDECFLVRELTPGGLAKVSGVVRYAPEFAAV